MPPRDLRNDVCGGAEAVDAKSPRVPHKVPRAITDQTCAQQRRGVCIVDPRWKLETIARIRDDVFGVAAIEAVAGEPCVIAQVLLAAQAERALAARPAEPRHAESRAGRYADTVALRDNFTDDLVTRNERQSGKRQIAVHDMQIGPTHAARMHAQ